MSTIIALCYGVCIYVSNCVHSVIYSRCIRWYRNKLRIITFTDDVRISRNSAVRRILTTKLSYRNIMIISAVIMLIGLFLLSTLTRNKSCIINSLYDYYRIWSRFLILCTKYGAIHNFGMEQRGSATSTSNFIRSLGMTLGITIFGMIQRTGFKIN